MRKLLLVGGAAALALSSTFVLAQGSPESLLPPGFDEPTPAPSPTPTPRPTATGEALLRPISEPVPLPETAG